MVQLQGTPGMNSNKKFSIKIQHKKMARTGAARATPSVRAGQSPRRRLGPVCQVVSGAAYAEVNIDDENENVQY
jgi:hypothetical protein